MQVRLPCDTYLRLMPIAQTDNDKNDDYLHAMYIECKNGVTIAVTTNRRIAAIEHIPDASADGSFFLIYDPALAKQCEAEKPFNGYVEITVNTMLQFANAKTMLGFAPTNNLGLFPADHVCTHWRTWLPKVPITQTGEGGMYWNYRHIAALGASAPSTFMRFPQHIDCNQTVIVRDMFDEKWLGLFMPNYKDDDGKIKRAEAATLPEWCK